MTDLRNELLNRDLEFTLFGMQLQSGDFVAFTATNRRERLDAPFAISRTITLPLGAEYRLLALPHQWTDGGAAHAVDQRPVRDRPVLFGHSARSGR